MTGEQAAVAGPVPLRVIAVQWTRLGCIGFGGPPAHIALLRKLVVDDRAWLDPREFEDGVAVVNLLPGPASTQLTIYCAWRLRGAAGALAGGAGFILPGLVVILTLSTVFLAEQPPGWVAGAAQGAGAAVPAVAVAAALGLVPPSWRRAGTAAARARWVGYLLAGGAAAALVGPFLVAVLIVCGLIEAAVHVRPSAPQSPGALVAAVPAAVTGAGLLSLGWLAFKVGALSFGGGFVIIPLMQHDAVQTYHWMTAGQFLTAVALGQVTPGPVVQTVAVVGYAAAGIGGGLLASLVAFTPSFCFVLGLGRHFDRLRRSAAVQAFLTGAGPAAIGAIAGAAIPLVAALALPWQAGVLLLAAGWLIGLRRGVVPAIVGAAALGVVVYLAGGPIQ
ncbi:MAG TPA: chromate efflux transporter [Streptosporangiaceae bacterium]|nr:chromate efflux transporter [Streptosporangiaceae bacterium]